jgi:hypothetical protein
MATAVAGVSSLGLMMIEHPGEVPGDESANRPDGFLHHHLPSAGDTRRDQPAIGAFALFAVPTQHVDGEAKFHLRLGHRLAHLQGQISGDRIDVVFEDARRFLHDRLALDRRCRAPDFKAFDRGLQRHVQLLRRGVRNLAESLFVGGIKNLLAAAIALAPFAADEQFEFFVSHRNPFSIKEITGRDPTQNYRALHRIFNTAARPDAGCLVQFLVSGREFDCRRQQRACSAVSLEPEAPDQGQALRPVPAGSRQGR